MMDSNLPTKLSGMVTKFKGNGRMLGYPTANINPVTSLQDGIYFGFADMYVYHAHPALIFVGTPTTMGDTSRRVEVHLLDIEDKDYYGLGLNLSVYHFHRPNQKFSSVTKLIQAIKNDEQTARNWFKLHNPSG